MDSGNQVQIKKRNKDVQIFDCFDQLPYESVIDILSRLPITSLIQFSFVSRSLNSLPHDPHLVNMHLSRSSINGSFCLILHSDYPIQNQLHFLQLSNKKVRKIDTPFSTFVPEFSIIGSSDGVLCLINSLFPESIYLYNPFTRYYSELPRNFNFQDHVIVYGFGCHPTTNDYKVIKIAYYPNPLAHPLAGQFRRFETNLGRKVSEVQIYSLSSNTWKNHGLVPYRLERWSSPGVVVSGRLHWVSRWGRFNDRFERTIVAFDIADEFFHVMKNPGLGSGTGSFGRWAGCNLGALDGRLCAAVPVPPGHGGFDIWVMKEYGVEESWAKEYRVGGYTPVSMISDKMERCHIWRNMFGRKLVKVLCVLESGEVLLEYRGGGLVCYDIEKESFKELGYPGMPKLYQAVVHVGTLNSLQM